MGRQVHRMDDFSDYNPFYTLSYKRNLERSIDYSSRTLLKGIKNGESRILYDLETDFQDPQKNSLSRNETIAQKVPNK